MIVLTMPERPLSLMASRRLWQADAQHWGSVAAYWAIYGDDEFSYKFARLAAHAAGKAIGHKEQS